MKEEVKQRRKVKVTITMEVSPGDEILAYGCIENVINEHIRDCKAFRDYGIEL